MQSKTACTYSIEDLGHYYSAFLSLVMKVLRGTGDCHALKHSFSLPTVLKEKQTETFSKM